MPEPTTPRLGVCHGPDGAANLREIYVASQGVCEVVLLVRAAVAAANPDIMRVAERFFECHVLSGGHVLPGDGALPGDHVAEIVAPLGLRGVTTFHDDELELADALHPATAAPTHNPWDKLVQRRVLGEHGLTSVDAVPVDAPEDLVRGFATLGRPCVLKPRRAAGGQGIAFIDADWDVRRQLDLRRDWTGLMLETRIDPAPHPTGPPWLGSLVSVETVSTGAERVHLGVLDKLPVAVTRGAGPGGADAVHVQGDLLPSGLSPERSRAARQYTGEILDALKVGPRVTHTELLLTPEGFDVLEVNGRLAGHTSRLFRLLRGPDLVRIALQVAVGDMPEVGPPIAPGAAAGVFPTFARRRGPVRTSLRRRMLREIPGVCAVDELAQDGADKSATQYRIANLTLRGDDRAALDASVGEVLRTLSEGFAEGGDG
ncbi:hypothetical protein ABGB18_20160 [Nonomuraea sp. B12E4]|uniref:ATP-grasp domain-containing protein n=1 Tax=Nonomuraea sp. B12E4 TaxID=3153564 RepID=UPI00325E4691